MAGGKIQREKDTHRGLGVLSCVPDGNALALDGDPGVEPGGALGQVVDEVDLSFRGDALLPTLGQRTQVVTVVSRLLLLGQLRLGALGLGTGPLLQLLLLPKLLSFR